MAGAWTLSSRWRHSHGGLNLPHHFPRPTDLASASWGSHFGRKRIIARSVGQRPAEPNHLCIQLQAVVAPAHGQPAVVPIAIGRPALDAVAVDQRLECGRGRHATKPFDAVGHTGLFLFRRVQPQESYPLARDDDGIAVEHPDRTAQHVLARPVDAGIPDGPNVVEP